MAYLENLNRSQIFTCPQNQSFSDPARRQNPTPREDPIQCSIMVLSLILVRVEWWDYHHSPLGAETLTPTDAVSEMKRQLHFLDRHLNKIQNSLSELQLVPSATPKSTRQGLIVKQRNLWPDDKQGPTIDGPLNPSIYLSDPLDIANETKTKEVHFSAYPSHLYQ